MSFTAQGPSIIAEKLYKPHAIHRAISSPEELSEAHLRQYQRDGFLAIENVFSIDEVESCRQALRDLIAKGDPRIVTFEDPAKGLSIETMPVEERERYVRKVMYFVEHDARLKAAAENTTLLRIVRELVGTEVRLLQDMALLKPAHVGREKPWHQDTAYFSMAPLELILGTWTALDDATVENGCMHVIPGSHALGPKPHHHDRDCQLSDEDVDAGHVVAVPLRPGGVMFFSGLAHHGTPPNRSSLRRRALQFHYNSVKCRRVESHELAEIFNDGTGYAGCGGGHRDLKVKRINETS